MINPFQKIKETRDQLLTGLPFDKEQEPQRPEQTFNLTDLTDKVKPFIQKLNEIKQRSGFELNLNAPFGEPLLKFPGRAGRIQSKISKFLAPETPEQIVLESAINLSPIGLTSTVEKKVAPKVFTGFKDLTTKIIERLKGKAMTSKQEILDFTNMPELKQAERDLIRNVVGEYKDKIPVQEFANKVKTELLPLERTGALGKYENISLPSEQRGAVANYSEHIYQSPIKTSAGQVHFNKGGTEGYFAHTRIEDLAPEFVKGKKPFFTNLITGKKVPGYEFKPGSETKTTRRVIELQSDLFQKGRLESETKQAYLKGYKNYEERVAHEVGISKLEPYRNTWYERIIREEVKQAAKDGKTKLQFPTGETAMEIEGLGEITSFTVPMRGTALEGAMRTADVRDLKVGNPIRGQNQDWIITDILGDGRFKAIAKEVYEDRFIPGGRLYEFTKEKYTPELFEKTIEKNKQMFEETFDISGKVDTNNPIYRFYEKEVGRYLRNKYEAELITDPQGVKWWQVDIKPEMAKRPIEAFGVLPFLRDRDQEENKPKPASLLMRLIQDRKRLFSLFEKPQKLPTEPESSLFLKERPPSQTAEISAYTASVSETDKRPRETATQTKVKEGKTIATNDKSLLGKKVKVNGIIYTIEDLMGPRFRKLFEETGKHMFDIFMEDVKKAKQFGRQRLPIEILD